jgi:hypothetical protein
MIETVDVKEECERWMIVMADVKEECGEVDD